MKAIKQRLLKIAVIVVMLAVMVALFVYSNFVVADSKNTFKGMGQCPGFTLDTYESDRETYSLSESRGKVTVINFWATWCGPCVQELPHFEKLLETYSEHVDVVAVHSDGITEDVKNYIENKAGWGGYKIIFAQDKVIDFAATDDADAVTTTLYERMGGGSALPVTVILSADGNMKFRRQGSITYAALEREVKLLLTEIR